MEKIFILAVACLCAVPTQSWSADVSQGRRATKDVCMLTRGEDKHTVKKWHVGYPGKIFLSGTFKVPGGGKIDLDAFRDPYLKRAQGVGVKWPPSC